VEVAFLLIAPGAILVYACLIVWRTRGQSCWSAIRGLPLRGRWLCALATALLAVPSVLVLLCGVLYTLMAIAQALDPT
jgi:hypothetical protein